MQNNVFHYEMDEFVDKKDQVTSLVKKWQKSFCFSDTTSYKVNKCFAWRKYNKPLAKIHDQTPQESWDIT